MTSTQRLSHIISTHIFIFATSLAMLVHSTWTFGTLFSGKQPEIDGSLENWIAYFLWVTPALLVALAIDVGQIQTSVKLSKARGNRQKITLGITFITLALAGYYLQWFHLAHHIPALEFGAGLSPDMQGTLKGLKDIAIFIVPALLPLSTILYTLSNDSPPEVVEPLPPKQGDISVTLPLIEQPRMDDDTEPYDVVASQPAEIERPKSVTRSIGVGDSDGEEKQCEHCNKVIRNARPNQKYCTVVCRNNAYKARIAQSK